MDREYAPRNVRLPVVVAVVVVAVVAFLVVVLWRVLHNYIDPTSPTEKKDLVQSFAVVVAGGVGSLSALAAVGNLYVSQKSLRQQRELELERADRERERELERAQEDALPAYLDQMIQLLNDKDRPLRQAKEGDEVSILARVRTITVLPRLDGGRKGSVLQFLYEAGLILKDRILVDLTEADLRGADLRQTRAANLRGADLSETNLHGAFLTHANLSGADLSGTDLIGGDLRGADLRLTLLSEADLSGTVGLTENLLSKARALEGATMPDGQRLKSDDNPDGPTFEEWLQGRTSEKAD